MTQQNPANPPFPDIKLRFVLSQFYALQKRYLFPVINETWISCQIGVLDGLSREPNIVLSGDGRELVTVLVTLRNPSVKNSNAMEPMGLKQCLSNMKKWNISINILTTDRHKTVRKILRVEFPEITHQFDLWHFCKSIIKKIIKACGKKKLLPLSLAGYSQ
ncbi:hypothetical protein KUCAC02_006880 [Chaenocephalus aceratus]|uniref:Uncharacterized protein n=1 Tax=Chaenocephalus aceratus TaxID=36190 RepID=A0ACB9VTD3_CHAAC|nr:hypothetical protein KUCAC02_006880 [Chaenocephalus aceratus]